VNAGLFVDASLSFAGPEGSFRLLGRGTRLVLDASGARWGLLARRLVRERGRARMRSLARTLEAQRLRVDVESGGRTIVSLGDGCRRGWLSWLLGGAPISRSARA
jgi:hypothetical protein